MKPGSCSGWGDPALPMARPKKLRDELIARGVRLTLECDRPLAPVAGDPAIHSGTVAKRCATLRPTVVLVPS